MPSSEISRHHAAGDQLLSYIGVLDSLRSRGTSPAPTLMMMQLTSKPALVGHCLTRHLVVRK